MVYAIGYVLDCTADRYFDPSTATAWDTLHAYLSGIGGEARFGSESFFARRAAEDPWLRDQLRADILAKILNQECRVGGECGGLLEKDYREDPVQGGVDLLAGIFAGRWEVTALGSYDAEWEVVEWRRDGTVTFNVVITNTMSNESIAHFLGYDDNPSDDPDPKFWADPLDWAKENILDPLKENVIKGLKKANPAPNLKTTVTTTVRIKVN